jgi:hypothetical protein
MNARAVLFIVLTAAAGLAPPAMAGGQAIPWPAELSGAARLPDGRLVLVDDETRDAIFLWTGQPGEAPRRVPITLSLDDLEGAATDSSGWTYLLTSHSLTKGGKLRADRQRIARLRLTGESAGLATVGADIRATLLDLLQVEGAASELPLNLEGLAWYPRGDELLLGVRAPLESGRAQVIRLGPARALFDPTRPAGDPGALHQEVVPLDLGGRGVRSLDLDPWRQAILILAGPPADGHEGSALYLWTPGEAQARLLRVSGLGEIRQPEGVVALAPPGPDGSTRVLVLGEGEAPVELTARP